jgi:putative redox protein
MTSSVEAPREVTRTTVHTRWRGQQRYDVARDDGPPIALDGSRAEGPGPVDALLGAFAACASMEVVDYLSKRRTPIDELEIVVDAERRTTVPRRVVSIRLTFHIKGETIQLIHAARSIALAVQTYCSVATSLASDIANETQLILNDHEHPVVRQHVTQVAV